MKLLALLPLAVLAADVVAASIVPARHHRIARRMMRKKRCLARPQNQMNTLADLYHSSPQTSHTPHPTSSTPQQQPTTTTPDQTPSSSPPTSNPPSNTPNSGVLNVMGTCGQSDGTPNPTKTNGPNGSIYWLNCGIDGSGWNPPYFTVDQVIALDLGDVLSRAGNPYEACRPHIDAFYQSAGKHGVPPILIDAIAMQEFSCNANTVGGNGEQGLMQITPDKCPNGASADCMNPYTNIDIGASYFKSTLNSCGGNLPQAIGQYNGWVVGMTQSQATQAKSEGRCFAQNNLDYLHQTLNGWLQGVDPRALGMGMYFNLDSC